MTYKVTLRNLDGETCKVEVEANDKLSAYDEAEQERGAGWMATDAKVIS